MIGPRTKAILTPNLVGNCPDWDRIRAIADAHGLKVVEDSCDVLDSWLRGTRTGTRSDISVTSFARTHSITAAGNGGMVGIDDPDLLDECLMLRRWGRRSEAYLYGSKKGDDDRFSVTVDGLPYDNIFVFENIGYNFEPSEIGGGVRLRPARQARRLQRAPQVRVPSLRRLVRDPGGALRAAGHHSRSRVDLDAVSLHGRRGGRLHAHRGPGVPRVTRRPDAASSGRATSRANPASRRSTGASPPTASPTWTGSWRPR